MAPELFISSETGHIDGFHTAKNEVSIFRVVHEALSNLVKYAGASQPKDHC